MVRECRPREREPVRSWLARRSTMATSMPASASSPANISPVGPPPATTTACSAIRHPQPPQVLVSAGDSAARPGSCRKGPVLYTLRMARSKYSFSLRTGRAPLFQRVLDPRPPQMRGLHEKDGDDHQHPAEHLHQR